MPLARVWESQDGGDRAAIRAPIDDYQDSERERLEPEFRRLLSEHKSKFATIDKLRKKLKVESPDALKEQSRHIADLEAELPDEPHRITLTTLDATPEALEQLMQANRGRMAVISDEGGMFDIMSGRYSFEAEPGCVSQGAYGWPAQHRPVFSKRLHRAARLFTMCIVPQPGVIQGLKDKPFMRNRGLLARFLYAIPESPIGKRENSPVSIPDGIHLDYRAVIARLLGWQPERPLRLGLTEPAYREWKELQRYVERLMGAGQVLGQAA